MISAAQLNKFITIEWETTTVNAVGTPTEGYQGMVKEKWAEMRVLTGGSEYGGEGTLPFTRVEFTIRYDEEVNYKCRIKYDHQYYEIGHIEEVGRKHFQRIKCVVWEGELSDG